MPEEMVLVPDPRSQKYSVLKENVAFAVAEKEMLPCIDKYSLEVKNKFPLVRAVMVKLLQTLPEVVVIV
jgi:hypothetical protein